MSHCGAQWGLWKSHDVSELPHPVGLTLQTCLPCAGFRLGWGGSYVGYDPYSQGRAFGDLAGCWEGERRVGYTPARTAAHACVLLTSRGCFTLSSLPGPFVLGP